MDVASFLDAAVELLAVESTGDRPDELERAMGLVLDFIGPGFSVERFESGGKPSALVYKRAVRPRFTVILNAHLDVVPAPAAQFRPYRDGDRLYARGAQDMKVSALAQALAFRELAGSVAYPLGLQLVTDEESGGSDGTLYQLREGVTGRFAVVGEASGLRIVTECKGVIRARLHAQGRSAHGAYPWLGDNALLKLHRTIDRIAPPHRADHRRPEIAALQAAARRHGYTGEFIRRHGTGDLRFYGVYGITSVSFGIGGDGQHGPSEYAEIATIAPYYQVLTDFLLGLGQELP
jgi:acetylornithine deacetylase/succinyl-diaminopimelate desuccinylase-like protein